MEKQDWSLALYAFAAYLLCASLMQDQWRAVYSAPTLLFCSIALFIFGLVIGYWKYRRGLAVLIHGVAFYLLFAGLILLMWFFGSMVY